MSPAVIDVRSAEDLRDVIHRAVQAITEGELVVFPTETVYGVAARALDSAAVEKLLVLKDRAEGHPLTLALKSAEEAWDYAPGMCSLAQRLARRCWPGPVTLVVNDAHPESLLRQLPESVQQAVSPAGTVGLRVPGHQLILDTMRMVAGPLVLSSANRSGQPDALDAQQAIDAFDDDVALVLDDGPSRFGQRSSVVRVVDDRFEILRAGIVPEKTLRRLSNLMVLIVCTGNTCRSPMAEMICRKHLAKRLRCSQEDLEDRGVLVMSAGVAAMSGGRAAQEAVEVMLSLGMDLSGHETQLLTESLVRYADVILTMTQTHRNAVLAQWPDAAERTATISVEGNDIADPIGGPLERYERCASEIEAELITRLDQLQI